MYSNEQLPLASDPMESKEWDIMRNQKSVLGGAIAKNLESDNLGRYSPVASRYCCEVLSAPLNYECIPLNCFFLI